MQRNLCGNLPVSAVLVALLVQPAKVVAETFDDFRGMWISRFEYNEDSTSDIVNRINNAADHGITDVFWQVRAKADAYYFSNFESPAEDWNQNIDPLQVAIDTAQSRGVKLHAWLNTMPIWRDSTQPSDPNHIFYQSDPSFRVTDINGNTEQLVPNPRGGVTSSFSDNYARVNHVLPEVQDHIDDVVNDLATNYDVDGIHLDYVRWLGPTDSGDGFRADWDYLPHDAYSHQLYQDATGGNGAAGGSFSQRQDYREWVQSRITDLVDRVGDTVDAAEVTEGREIELSAAVWNNPTTASREYLQDYRTWLEQDLLDIAIPMVYLRESNRNLMQGFLDDIFATPTNTDVSIGLGTYLHDSSNGGVAETISQMQQVYNDGRADSLTFFSYPSLLGGGSLSNQRRAAVEAWYAALEGPDPDSGGDLAPGSTVFTNFDLPGDEGYFSSSITAGGQTTIDATSSAEQTAAEAHLGEGSQLLDIEATGSWTLRHLSGGANPANNLAFTTEGSIGFWLKTDTPGLTVQIALDDPGSADRGTLQAVIADGEWRLYEWDLEDDTQWEGWVTGDGVITGPTATMDAIFLYGTGDATVYLDTVAHNPAGSLLVPAVPGDYDGDGTVDANDYAVWRDAYGETGDDLSADGNNDGVVNAADYAVWRDAAEQAAALAVPEPAAGLMLMMAALLSSAAPRLRKCC